jgi:signal transduction histidine kinase
LNLESPQVDTFSEDDSHLLQALATQAVIAIQEARLLDALLEVAQFLLVQPYHQVCQRLVNLACDLLNVPAGGIWTQLDDQLVLLAGSEGILQGGRMPLKGSLAEEAMLTCAPVVSADVRTDPRFTLPDLAQQQGWIRALVVPLLAGDNSRPIGAFSVFDTSSEPGRFAESEWDKKVLSSLAYHAALAVQYQARQEELSIIQEQKAIAETFAAVGDIASNLLHNLNNKVGTIPVRIQGIEDKCGPALQADPYLAANLAEIERSAMEAMETVRENLSHLHPIHLVPVNVAACIQSAIKAADLPDGVTVQTQDLESLPVIIAGERSLILAFTNLLENAADAMDGKGLVNISGRSSKSWVEITISDTGPGISPELHDRIFELHFSGFSSSKPGKLGFGLWWVKTVMTRLGGSVTVESNGSQGTTFCLKLPRVEEK